MRAPVVERDDAAAVVDDKNRAMGAANDEPALCFQLVETSASVKPVFGMSMSVPSAFNSSEAIDGRHDP